MKLARRQWYLRTCYGRGVGYLCLPNLGGLGFAQIAVLARGFSSDDWPARSVAIAATRSFEDWGEDKGVLIASWHRFKGLEADAIVTIETPRTGTMPGSA